MMMMMMMEMTVCPAGEVINKYVPSTTYGR
jgi:hypothetical protein